VLENSDYVRFVRLKFRFKKPSAEPDVPATLPALAREDSAAWADSTWMAKESIMVHAGHKILNSVDILHQRVAVIGSGYLRRLIFCRAICCDFRRICEARGD
jgi:hypothetical protein